MENPVSVLPGEVLKGPSSDTLNPKSNQGNHRRKSVDYEGAIASEYENQMDEINAILDSEDSRSILRILDGSFAFKFIYKKRKCLGSAIHIAALNSKSDLLERLLQMHADINVECKYHAFEKEGRAQPIHLAVQGCLENVKLLMDAGADINARVKLDGQSHFCPIHDAVYFRKLEMVNFLLTNMASVNDKNLDGMTPLHVAAKMGASDVSELLVRHGADIEVRDDTLRTPLKVAVESGVFPPRRLHLLARFRIGDILIVSEHCPTHTVDFMRALLCDYVGVDRADQVTHKTYVADELQKEVLTVEHWIELLESTPDAADYLLEILTVEPDEESVYHHPLPNQAAIQELRADYNTDDSWKCETEQTTRDSAWPAWHDRLAPAGVGGTGRRPWRNWRNLKSMSLLMNNNNQKRPMRPRLVPVRMRQLRLKGIVFTPALLALSMTQYVEIFKNPAIVALLQYCWEAFVGRWYTLQVIHRSVELLVLSAWTFSKTHRETNFQVPMWQRRLTWTIMLETAVHDVVYELCQAYGFVVTMRSPGAYFGNLANYLDVFVIGSFCALVIDALIGGQYQLDVWPEFFAVLVFMRWLHVLYNLRAFKLGMIGVKSIIPILHSVKKIGGMMIIVFFVFCGFCHAFLVLDNGVSTGGPWMVLIGTIKLLFTVDGDGINQTLKLGGRGDAVPNGDYITAASLLIAVIVFCISLLNIFIAVHGRAYEQAHSHATNLFLQERADICVHCMVQPMFPSCLLRGRMGLACAWAVLAVIFIGLWVLCLCIEECPGLVAALLLFAGVFILKCLLVIRPWSSEEVRRRSYLWWCAPSTKTYNTADQDEQMRTIEDMAERVARLEQSLMHLQNALKEKDAVPMAVRAGVSLSRWR